MTEAGQGPPANGEDRFLVRKRPRWVLILFALIIILLAALASQTLDDAPGDTTTSDPGVDVSHSVLLSFTHTCEGRTCTFATDDADTGAVTGWRWDFGDGETSSGASAKHTYQEEDIFRVSLMITDGSRTTGTVTRGVNPGAIEVEASVSPVLPPSYPFGPHIGSSGGWDLVDPIYSSAHVSPHPETVIDELNAARADRKSIILLLARSAGNYKNRDGTFSLEMWKAEIDRYAGFDFTPWVEDGTLLAHYLISEPMSRGRWGGMVIPVELLDEMARYSKEYWPYLATTVREQPTDLMIHAGGYNTPVAGWDWSYLDAGWARYLVRKGSVDDFIDAEVQAAREQELGLLFGMNVLAGGDGSSETIGYNGGWVMSPDELVDYGAKLISEPYGCANYMWHLNHDGIQYFGLPEIDAAMEALAEIARSRVPISCIPK